MELQGEPALTSKLSEAFREDLLEKKTFEQCVNQAEILCQFSSIDFSFIHL